MTTPPLRIDPQLDAAAARWAARLDGGDLSAADRAELAAWLDHDPAHRPLLTAYCQFSADLEELLPALVAAGKIEVAAGTPPRRSRRPWVIGLAAAAAVVLGLAWFRFPPPQIQNAATAVAQRHALVLADGTKVELNADTGLRFENTRTERRVRLSGGEAYFAVARDPARPFLVETPAGLVRVTGTAFNVRADAAAAVFDVAVVEGSVQAQAGGPAAGADSPRAVALAAGDRFVAQAGRKVVRHLTPAQLAEVLAWREGRAVFTNEPLADAVARFAHYHGRAIALDPALAGETIGGRYSLDDLSGFLAALEIALPLQVRYDLTGSVTLTARTRD